MCDLFQEYSILTEVLKFLSINELHHCKLINKNVYSVCVQMIKKFHPWFESLFKFNQCGMRLTKPDESLFQMYCWIEDYGMIAIIRFVNNSISIFFQHIFSADILHQTELSNDHTLNSDTHYDLYNIVSLDNKQLIVLCSFYTLIFIDITNINNCFISKKISGNFTKLVNHQLTLLLHYHDVSIDRLPNSDPSLLFFKVGSDYYMLQLISEKTLCVHLLQMVNEIPTISKIFTFVDCFPIKEVRKFVICGEHLVFSTLDKIQVIPMKTPCSYYCIANRHSDEMLDLYDDVVNNDTFAFHRIVLLNDGCCYDHDKLFLQSCTKRKSIAKIKTRNKSLHYNKLATYDSTFYLISSSYDCKVQLLPAKKCQ